MEPRIEHYRGDRAVQAELQELNGGKWRTINSWGKME
jgi:hypothetical protein